MRFILETDYATLIRSEIQLLLASNGYSDSRLSMAENMAISQIKNFLKGTYDVDVVFAGVNVGDPDTRNAHVVMITIDCALYHLYTNTAPDRIPEHRSQRYQDAMDWLKMVAKGEAMADLPIITTPEGDNSIHGIKLSSKYPTTKYRY